MTTLKQLVGGLETIPAAVSWYLADLGEAKGKQELFTRQSPQRLKVLREHALIESAVSSNRIEGVEVDMKRIGTIVFGKSHLRDRSEEEVRGYREALNLIHEKGSSLPITEETILELHRLARGETWDAGKYKENDSDTIERHPDGTSRIRFRTVSAKKTPAFMKELVELWNACTEERWVHPIIALAAFNLDFLSIHPFRDGNGRVSRLLLLLMCYHLGIEVGRYISIERLIEQNKERYYETLALSSQRWHEGDHDPWHYISYLCFILNEAYKEFSDRVGFVKSPKGEKTAMVVRAIEMRRESFRIADLQGECPNVSVDLIRRVLKDLQAEGRIECLVRGQRAVWRKIGKGSK
ncbi:MAG: Fic family protein [Armatimonadetes bacterium]|nr:Fic family protein [Armatimonadota bacterium]